MLYIPTSRCCGSDKQQRHAPSARWQCPDRTRLLPIQPQSVPRKSLASCTYDCASLFPRSTRFPESPGCWARSSVYTHTRDIINLHYTSSRYYSHTMYVYTHCKPSRRQIVESPVDCSSSIWSLPSMWSSFRPHQARRPWHAQFFWQTEEIIISSLL